MTQHMANMCVLLLLLRQILSLSLERIHPLNPLSPICSVFCQQIASEYAIARGILDVDVEVRTEHWDYDVEVYLQFVGDAFLDAEEVRFVAGVPAAELGEGENSAD